MNNNDLILSAAQKNQPERIRQLVEQQGVPVNHTNGVGQSALHVACLWGHGTYSLFRGDCVIV